MARNHLCQIVPASINFWLNNKEGDDSLFGNAGNESLEGESGEDTLDGGIGDDSSLLLKQLWLEGEIPKSRVPQIVGYQERQARNLQNKLMQFGLIQADSVRSPLKLNFPLKVSERYFPSLF